MFNRKRPFHLVTLVALAATIGITLLTTAGAGAHAAGFAFLTPVSEFLSLKSIQPPLPSATPELQLAPEATYTVTNTDDDGTGSLRQAIRDANASVGVADTIGFAFTTPCPDNVCTINLTSTSPADTGTALVITDTLTIQGPGASSLIIQRSSTASSQFRIFRIFSETTATISGVTIANGLAANGTGGGGSGSNGGGILNEGGLTLTAVTVNNNRAGNGGGPSFPDNLSIAAL